MELILLFAFIGGVVTILSPCILPILPVVLAGSAGGGKTRPWGIVTGFVASFTFFTLFLTSIVNALGISASSLRQVAVVILLLFGLTLLIPAWQVKMEQWFSRLTPKQNLANKKGWGGGFLIGLSLGLIWTPCVGPILASVISLALTGQVTSSAFFITLAYSLGTALPMLAIIYGGRKLLQRAPSLVRRGALIQKIFGLIMILTALAIFFNWDRTFQSYILQKFPNYGSGLTTLEDNEKIKKELDKLEEGSEQLNLNNTADENYPLAPELKPQGEWFHSQPLTLSELKGKVVLLDFMTYSCINCIRTFPYLQAWHEKYEQDDLVVIGIHTPEFEFEKNPDNVKKALADFGLTFPVMQDNGYQTWRAYGNRYWPRKYLIDHQGRIVYDHIGEGEYAETEKQIQYYLKQAALAKAQTENIEDDLVEVEGEKSQANSPETYFGSLRNRNFGSGQSGVNGEFDFPVPEEIKPNTLYLTGKWRLTDEYAESLEPGSKIIFKYQASKVFLVAGADEKTTMQIERSSQDWGEVEVQEEKLYRLVETEQIQTDILEIIVEKAGLQVFAFTFG